MDRGTTERLYGNYRAQVIENKDKQQFGRVLVWIPDLMQNVNSDTGIWARPANNPLGGRNDQGEPDHHYMGASYIPRKGAWTWVFFESGNINRPYYFGALDIENTKVLPENQVGENYQDKWTLFKSHEGRAIVISDDDDDQRTEVTGQKHKLNTPPTGDLESVYKIETNMNTFLIDERDEYEKILIKTRKGDYIKLNIKDEKIEIFTESDIEIKNNGVFNITAKGDINILSEEGHININAQQGDINILADLGDININAETSDINLLATSDNINLQAFTDINLKTDVDIIIDSGNELSLKAASNGYFTAGYNLNHLAGMQLNQDGGAGLNDQAGMASPASAAGTADPADPADPAEPNGDRTPSE